MMGNSDATAAHWAELYCGARARWWERVEQAAAKVADLATRAATDATLRASKWRGYEAHNRDEMVRSMGGAPRSIR